MNLSFFVSSLFLVPKYSPEELSIDCNATFGNASWKPEVKFDWNGATMLFNGSFVARNCSVTLTLIYT